MLRLTTFGGLALSRDGTPLTGAAAQRSRLSLLALLATAGTTGISRDKMLLHLWPESDEERARHALKQAVYSLRRELGSDEVIVGTASLSLNPAIITSDVRDFELAIAAGDYLTAAALYAGPFLDGVHLKDSVEFDRWSAEQRARYAHMWSSALEKLATESEARGEWRAAAGHWRTLASAEPLNGRLTGALIRCLAESGDIGAALQQYRIHESLLQEEVGAAPEADVAALAESIKAGTWQRSPDKPRAPIAVAAVTASTSTAPQSPDVATGAPSVDLATPRPTPSGPRLGVTPARRRRRRSTAMAFLLGMLFVTVTAAGIGYMRLDPEMRAAVGTLLTRKPLPIHADQIVIGMFENHTGNPDVDGLAEKAADWFTREFQQAQLKVVDARTRQYDAEVVKLTPLPLRPRNRNIAVARENGSAYVIVGNVYKEGDSLEANVSVIDVAKGTQLRQWSAYGSLQHDNDLIRKLLGPSVTFMANLFDSTAGTVTVSSASPPSREATTRVGRAWERFFQSPNDTTLVFKELDSAAAMEPSWATPVLMRTYILDVKSQWADAESFVRRLRPLRPTMSPIEQAALDLFESDLKGEAMARLAIARRLKDLSPGSAEMPLLSVVSLLYAGRPDEAVAALQETKPDYGMNLLTPAYWEWRTQALHEAGPAYAKAEEESAKNGLDRFPRHPASTFAMVRVYAERNDPRLRELIDRGIPESGRADAPPRDPVADKQVLRLLAGRELRAHGYGAVADSLFRALAAELATLSPTASNADRLRQAHAFYEAKDYPMARAAFAAIVARDSMDIESEGRLATASWYVHDTVAVKRIDTRLASLKRPYMMGVNIRWRANIAAVQGRTADALALFELAVRQGHRMMDTPPRLSIHHDADFVAIRGTPGYKVMMKSLASSQIL